MKLPVKLLAGLLLAPVTAALAASGNVEAGRVKAAPCAGCHGPEGISTVPGIPNLAGQTDPYIQWQLVFFRSGRRPNPQMSAIVTNLSDEDIRDLGAYFATLPRNEKPAEIKPDPGLRTKGEAVAQQHRCANCHMDNYQGKQAAPAIAHQHEDYLVKALTDYRSAARPSVGVAAMTEAASTLSDDDIAAVAHYLAGL